MRMSGQVIGAFVMTHTRRSVIFSEEGFELVLTFWGRASRASSAQKLAPTTAAPLKKPRRPPLPSLFPAIDEPAVSNCLPYVLARVYPRLRTAGRDRLH